MNAIHVEIVGGDIADGVVYAVHPGTRTISIPTFQDPWSATHPGEWLIPRITTITVDIETDGVHHWVIWPGDPV